MYEMMSVYRLEEAQLQVDSEAATLWSADAFHVLTLFSHMLFLYWVRMKSVLKIIDVLLLLQMW